MLIGLLLSSIQVLIDYFDHEHELNATINQIIAVSRPSVLEAAYKLDRQIAAQIANGLLEYNFIVKVELLDEFKNTLTRKQVNSNELSSTAWLTRLLGDEYITSTTYLYAPKDNTTSYGTFSFVVNRDVALASFYQRAISVFLFGLFRNVVLSGIFLYIFSLVLTKPLVKIARDLSSIDPSKAEGLRLAHPPCHEHDELGNIVKAANDFFISNEIHLQKRAEAENEIIRRDVQLSSIIENSVDAIGVSKAGIHTLVNPAYVKMFGYTHEDQLIGKPIFLLIADGERERIANYVKRRAKNLEIESFYLTKGLKHNGAEFDMEVNVSVYGPEGDKSTLVILRDITERIQIEEQLRHAQKMEAIGTLAGGIAHDFNNILAAIIGYTEMAKSESIPGSAVVDDLNEVLEAGERARKLVQQILAFSRQSKTEKQIFFPETLLKETIKLIRPSLPATIEISLNIEPAAGPIDADPTEIHQLLMNLYTNSFHSMEISGGQLDISLKQVALDSKDIEPETGVEAGNFVQLTIADTGVGINPEIRSRIFDPYFTTKEIGKGTGMGLSIVHGIVQKTGGFITLESTLHQGTTINIFLPVVDKFEQKANFTSEILPLGSERILLIDDEETLTTVGKNMLENLGYSVTALNNSIEAKKLFEENPDGFDLVITDQTMPGLTGVDLSKAMLTIRPKLPIILCTGFSSIVNEDEAIKAGICEYTHKPLGKREIAFMIRRILDKTE